MKGTNKNPVLVLGATGNIGRGTVQALLEAGYPVLAIARDRARLADLQQHFASRAGLDVLAGSVTDDAAGAALADAIRQRKVFPAAIVACLGGAPDRGRLLERPAQFLRAKLDQDLLPHLVAAHHLLPLLEHEDRFGSYLIVGGPGAEHPWAGYGHVSIAAAALRMLARVLHEEARNTGVRVQLLSIARPARTERNRACACPEWPSALDIGRRAVDQLRSPVRADAVLTVDPRHRPGPAIPVSDLLPTKDYS
ncbi:MAG TPA: SDR family oxidoreductase [Rhodanobacteraceae bacterium]|nr:SDR family oxidoreductase [Rhodanobacteraceae bacterium]